MFDFEKRGMTTRELLSVVVLLARQCGYEVGPGGTLIDKKTGRILADGRTEAEMLRDAVNDGDIRALRELLKEPGHEGQGRA